MSCIYSTSGYKSSHSRIAIRLRTMPVIKKPSACETTPKLSRLPLTPSPKKKTVVDGTPVGEAPKITKRRLLARADSTTSIASSEYAHVHGKSKKPGFALSCKNCNVSYAPDRAPAFICDFCGHDRFDTLEEDPSIQFPDRDYCPEFYTS